MSLRLTILFSALGFSASSAIADRLVEFTLLGSPSIITLDSNPALTFGYSQTETGRFRRLDTPGKGYREMTNPVKSYLSTHIIDNNTAEQGAAANP